MIFVSNTIQYNRFKEGVVTPEQSVFLGFPTPEQGDRVKGLAKLANIVSQTSLFWF